MTVTLGLLAAMCLVLAFANGANDNFKGVATLYGSGAAGYRRALALATVTTAAGGLASLALAGSLVQRFGGHGLVPEATVGNPAFLCAVAAGAAATVLLASRLGIPISTTHAITGGLVGASVSTAGSDFQFQGFGIGFLLPLLSSPLIAALAVTVLSRLTRGLQSDTCICLTTLEAHASADGTHLGPSIVTPVIGSVAECAIHGATPIATSARAATIGHYFSAAAVGFARGVNDTPKLVALLLPSLVVSPDTALIGVTVLMAAGGLVFARRVGETMSHRITPMNERQGFVANVITAGLVLSASGFGLPVSTTHVSNGALFGVGVVTGQGKWRMISQIVLAWIVTLPCAAVCAAVAWYLLN